MRRGIGPFGQSERQNHQQHPMRSHRTFNRRHLFLAAFALLASAGLALAAVCTNCNGSGNGPFPCFQCKGTGQLNGFRCNFCCGR